MTMNFAGTPMYTGEFWATVIGIIVGSGCIIAIVLALIFSRCYPGLAASQVSTTTRADTKEGGGGGGGGGGEDFIPMATPPENSGLASF